jgi:uncharacterized protein (DUF1786 family)
MDNNRGVVKRKQTKDPAVDVVLLLEEGPRWATALFVNDCGRVYGVQEHKTETEANTAFAERYVR